MTSEVKTVAWRNLIGGDRWLYTEADPREVHDNGKQVDELVLRSAAEFHATYMRAEIRAQVIEECARTAERWGSDDAADAIRAINQE